MTTFRVAISALALLLALAPALTANAGMSITERRGPCEAGGTMRVSVALVPPPGKTLAGVKVNLDYPEQAVTLPGFMDQPEVKARVKEIPAGFLVSPNDLDDALVVALAGTSGLPAGRIFTVDFDRCRGVRKAAASDFHCKVEQASTETGVLVDGATCTVKDVGGETGRSTKSKPTKPTTKKHKETSP